MNAYTNIENLGFTTTEVGIILDTHMISPQQIEFSKECGQEAFTECAIPRFAMAICEKNGIDMSALKSTDEFRQLIQRIANLSVTDYKIMKTEVIRYWSN